ncbi:glycoside hydrolase/deacetylase [Choiromyces venosus 120613-1]|uniref:Glycoside hydrolase/deacetylase n=1 Tax=Choiromyces venosus 120613-1 TaxID=1336337 RepID=A0A3N4JLH8_9PEZI|nr:glycoside hydrolase/deacetylase [Choiromyces venosus 120613-1]
MISPISSIGLLWLSTYFGALVESTAIPPNTIFSRQSTTPDGTCGIQNSGNGNGYRCPDGTEKCCSQWGWCGGTSEYCGTGCQPGYGACDNGGGGTVPPDGGRSRPGNVPYGSMISSCTTGGVVALTFDDGPYIYTSDLLDLLARYQARATFFVNGQNWGAPITDPSNQDLIRRMISGGHQVGSHTWSHPSLSSLSTADMTSQMTSLESAITSAIGKYPTYMRPPYFECNDACLGVMDGLSYHVIYTNLDTLDWANTGNIQVSMDIFSQNVASNSLVLAHDVHPTTVYTLAEHMIVESQNRGLRLVTVGECLGDPSENWYRT